MDSLFRLLRTSVATLLPLCVLTATVWAAPVKPQLQITGYVIAAEIDPSIHRLTAKATVTFTALEDLTSPVFELNRPANHKITDAASKPLQSERLANDGTIRFTLATPLPKGTTTTLHLRIRGHHHRQRRRPRRRPQARRHPGAHHLPALPRALVSHHRPL